MKEDPKFRAHDHFIDSKGHLKRKARLYSAILDRKLRRLIARADRKLSEQKKKSKPQERCIAAG